MRSVDWRKLLKNKHVRFGIPFLIATVGGSFGLQAYSQVRYDVQKTHKTTMRTKEIQKLIDEKGKKSITIEEAYEEYKNTVDLDDWKNIRGPRPWESDNTQYKELIELRLKESKNQWVFK